MLQAVFLPCALFAGSDAVAAEGGSLASVEPAAAESGEPPLPSPTHGDPASTPDKGAPSSHAQTTKPKGYGLETALFDGVSIALATPFLVRPSNVSAQTLAQFGMMTYLAGPPLVHAAHRNGRAAWADLVLRLVAPPGLGVAGYLAGNAAGGTETRNIPMAIGFVSGVAFAMAFDALFLAEEPRR